MTASFSSHVPSRNCKLHLTITSTAYPVKAFRAEVQTWVRTWAQTRGRGRPARSPLRDAVCTTASHS